MTVGDTDYTATVVGEDDTSDVAVLKIDATGLTPATVGDSDGLAVGDNVLAVGNPLGELGGTVTSGIVSALNRSVTIQAPAPPTPCLWSRWMLPSAPATPAAACST